MIQTPNCNRWRVLPRPIRTSGGFTLVELLIVIAILMALAVLVVIMASKAKTKALETKAATVVRQAAMASITYMTENNGGIPRVIDQGEGQLWTGATWVSDSYWGRLQPYLYADIATSNQTELSTQIKQRLLDFFGTTDLKTMKGTYIQDCKIAGDKGGIAIPFGFNKYVCQPWNKLARVQSFSNPGQTVYFTYGWWQFDESDGKVFAKLPNSNPSGSTNIYWFQNRTAPMIFLDGHLEMVTMPIADRRYK